MKISSLAKFCVFSLALFSIATIAVIASTRALSQSQVQSAAMSKIAPWVLEQTADGKQAEFLIVLADQADLKGAEALKTKEEKGRFVRDALWNKAQATQGPLLQWLRERNLEHRAYYLVNLIWVKAGADVVQALAARPDVLRIEGNPHIRNIPDPIAAPDAPMGPESPTAIEPGITHTGAPLVWSMGYTGQGIVVAGADTGYRWDHTTLQGKYRGWDGSNANHDYNWHDSIHSSTGPCVGNSPQPCDDNSHGTHTMGTVVGDDGGSNQIGMAPGARWIACRNMNQGVGTPATYIECMEFFLAPYPVAGTPAQGNPDLAPDVTNNSWGCPPDEGCSPASLQAAVEGQRAAGIMMVVSAGNGGPTCSTVSDPPGIYDAAYSIGALNTGADTIASFSSRGPVTVDGSNRMKPDISAPGTSTRSAVNSSTTAFGSKSGTSMASPHVAGAVALLYSAYPGLRGNVSMTETILNEEAIQLGGELPCDIPPGNTPNNTFGHGRLNIKAAVDRALLLPRLTSAVSRKTHPGTENFSIPLPLTGEPGVECRSSAGNHTLVFTFNNNVVSGSASVTGGTGNVSGSPTFAGKTMTVHLSGVADVQKITVTLSNVTDNLGQVLPTTPLSVNMLIGDTTGNKTVNSSDVAQTKAQSGIAANATNFRQDVTVSGSINASDVSLVKSRSGIGVP